ncbi:LPS export ABC transporter permease LptF [Pseudogemmobacter sp. W21_MBD1_M6]|uniref:LPS export ABC transporter permease LptF n=1 Tax=Pseudogemmobacter sp. W21_MBD1_M6 TaxID=3240271 RepID=UPI003F986D3E
MARFDRYMLSQLFVVFGFFALVLVLVYWVNRAVLLFDQLIADGQSFTVFLHITALYLPGLIALVLPIASFAAAVYVTNRMTRDSEMVVVQGTGYSPFRLARPVLAFGIMVMLIMSVLTHILVPVARTQLEEQRAEIAENVTARFLREGTFLHPATGITFYIRQITSQGELRDIFLSDARVAQNRTTYTAKSALLVRDANGPKLVMFDGLAQTLQADGTRLFTTTFSDFSYDIGTLFNLTPNARRSYVELPTAELLFPTPAVIAETGESAGRLVYFGHYRFAQPLLAVPAALIGFATLLLGGFSRFGVWRQILGAIVLLLVVNFSENLLAGTARSDPSFWPLVYVPGLLGTGIGVMLLWVAGKPPMLQRRRAPEVPI